MDDLNLGFTKAQNQKIVDAILKGLKTYVAERRDKKATMLVSAGYAWTKSNHIETALGLELQSLGIAYNVKRIASWDYLQFSIADEKILFLVKSPSFIPEFKEKVKTGKEHYIREYAKSNDHIIKSDYFQNQVEQKQLALPLDDIPELFDGQIEDVDKSYIVVYEIDSSGMIGSIKNYLPNSDGQLYEVDDLTMYIEDSPFAFTPEETIDSVDIFNSDQANATDTTFEFEVAGKLKSNTKVGSA